ncbi:unnamed protein product [Peronospora farinosa]|uniref:Uncharacterized protein n=1 Tax=Peronospora farinosa TaxID=134698 RepID=A0AAV0T5D0_9STRA|nr:unnamed protein product [Peronospora farinosa]CAI5722730.1 unnamed protein product [Peronospora farinosa]
MQKDKYIMLRTYSGETNYTKYLPVHCKSLPHVCRLIDEYLVDSINPQVLQDACEHGASSDDLEFIRKRTAPKWTNVNGKTVVVRGRLILEMFLQRLLHMVISSL